MVCDLGVSSVLCGCVLNAVLVAVLSKASSETTHGGVQMAVKRDLLLKFVRVTRKKSIVWRDISDISE